MIALHRRVHGFSIGDAGRPWSFEVYYDLTCWMVGVNFGVPPFVNVANLYVHVWPFICGIWRMKRWA